MGTSLSGRAKKSGDEEVADLQEAARYLKCSPRTLQDWISNKRFGSADGLRRVGDLVRVYMPVLRERVKRGTLMKSGEAGK